MTTHAWSGYWPPLPDEYPPNGARIRYEHRRSGETREGVVQYVWCGIEPAITCTDGTIVIPTFDAYEVIETP